MRACGEKQAAGVTNVYRVFMGDADMPGACSILSSFLFRFPLFHFPAEFCTRHSSPERSAIDLKLQHNVYNGLSSRSVAIFANLTES